MSDFDPKAVVVQFRGVPLTGFAPGSFVSAERSEDSYSVTVGADGEYARTRSRNMSGTVTLTLLATSPANQLLLAWLREAEALGTGKGPLSVKNLRGTELVFSPEAWLARPANLEFADEVGTREWTFQCGRLEFVS